MSCNSATVAPGRSLGNDSQNIEGGLFGITTSLEMIISSGITVPVGITISFDIITFGIIMFGTIIFGIIGFGKIIIGIIIFGKIIFGIIIFDITIVGIIAFRAQLMM